MPIRGHEGPGLGQTRFRHEPTPREPPGLATALIRSTTTFSCSLLSSSATAVTHPWLLHVPHSSASTAMACSTWMPRIGRAGTDPRSQDADTDNARSVTSDRSRQIDTGMYVLSSQSTCARTSHGPQAVTTLASSAARQRDTMATYRRQSLRDARLQHVRPRGRRRLPLLLHRRAWRGVPDGYYPILDRTPKGRDEGDRFQLWIRRHDEYDHE